MSLTGVTVNEASGEFIANDAPQSATAFIVGAANRGPEVPTPVYSQSRLTRLFGPRLASSNLHDAYELAVKTGASRVVVLRDIAANAVAATVAINNASSTVACTFTASSRGAWGNNLSVVVTGTGPFTAVVRESSVEVERYENMASVADLVAKSANSIYGKFTAGVSGIPVAGTSNAASGSDGAALSTTTLETALATATANFGEGQVLAPGYTTGAAHNALAAHCGTLAAGGVRRHFTADAPFTGADKAARLAAAVAAGQALQQHAFGKRGELIYPPVICPGLTAGTTRTIPASALLAGLWAASDRENVAGTPLSGPAAQTSWPLGLAEEYEDDASRDALNKAGVTLLRMRPGAGGYPVVTVYDDRAVTTSERGSLDRNASDDRLLMVARARLLAAAEPFRGRKIDAAGKNLADLRGALTAVGGEFWEAGLLGVPATQSRPASTFADAWQVSASGNPATQTWEAAVAITIARTGEQVVLNILNQPTAA